MGRWLAEFSCETPDQHADNTDVRCLTSVTSARHPGVLDEKPELLQQVRAACTGLSITPDQFMVLLNDQDKAAILGGEIPVVPTLRAYAESFSKGIRLGRIKIVDFKAA